MADESLCKIDGCGKPASRRGWCAAHYRRWQRNGDPLGGRATRPRRGDICTVPECGKKHFGLGLCKMHYRRKRIHGDLSTRLRPGNGEALAFLHEKAMTFDGRECLLWPFYRQDNGYASLTIDGRTQLVHRVVCEAVHGEPPTPEHEVAHSCGNGTSGCVNPRHLRWDTHKGNQEEMVAHGKSARGERHHRVKLTMDEVLEIRRLKGSMTQIEMAEMFSVSRTTISCIHSRRKWGWLD